MVTADSLTFQSDNDEEFVWHFPFSDIRKCIANRSDSATHKLKLLPVDPEVKARIITFQTR